MIVHDSAEIINVLGKVLIDNNSCSIVNQYLVYNLFIISLINVGPL